MDILSITIFNLARKLDYKDLASCACVSKKHNELCNDLWKQKRIKIFTCLPKSNDALCCYCKTKRVVAFDACLKCSKNVKNISATDAKKLWLLDDNDLAQLQLFETYHRAYRKYIRLYRLEEVINKSLYKHNGPHNLYNKLHKPLSKAKTNRLEQIQKLKIPSDSLQYKLCIEDFLKNGKGGLKLVKDKLDRFDEFQKINIPSYIDVTQLRSDFINNIITIDAIKNKIDQEKIKLERTQLLTSKLSQLNLELRYDSKICKDYIESRINDIDFVLNTMLEMDFLYKNTNYKNIISKLISDEKDNMRSIYGYIPHDEYQEILNDTIPELSRQAKIRAIINIPYERLPEVLHKYKNMTL